MQLKIRDLKRFGISGLMSESGSVFYSSDFKTRSLGRVSDLIAAKLKDVHADEFRLRALLLYGLYESSALAGSEAGQTPSSVSLEVGLESDYLVIGVSFNWNENSRPDFDSLEARVGIEKKPSNDFEKILGLIHQHSDHVVVRYCEVPRQIEVVSIIGLDERVSNAKLEVISVLEPRSEALPDVAEYTELGDLPYVELTKEKAETPAALHTDDSLTISGGVEEPEVEQKFSGDPQEAEAVQNVKSRPDAPETEQKISGLPAEEEISQDVSGLEPEAEVIQKLSGSTTEREMVTRFSGSQSEEVDGMTVISAKEAEDGIEAELRKVNALPTEQELFTRLKSVGFTDSELLMLRQGTGFTPEIRERLQVSNVLPEEIQRVRIISQQQQLFQRLEASGFTPVEIQRIASGSGNEPDLIRRLTGLGYQPPEVESLFSNAFELAEKIYQIRSGDSPVPIEAYRRVAAPVFTREELLAKIRAQFPELGDADALKASNEEFQRLIQTAREQVQNLSGGVLPKSNDDMADWLSSFKDGKRPDFKSIPFNPNQIHAVEAAFGKSNIDTQSLSDAEYEKFMNAIRKPAVEPRSTSARSPGGISASAESGRARPEKISQNQSMGVAKEKPQSGPQRSAAPIAQNKGPRAPAAEVAQPRKQDQLEAELLKKRIRDLENQLKFEKTAKQNLQQQTIKLQQESAGVKGPGPSRTGQTLNSPAAIHTVSSEQNDPIEKIEIKGETKRVVSRAASEPEKKNKETLFTKLFNKKEEDLSSPKDTPDATASNPEAVKTSSSGDDKIVISGSKSNATDDSGRLVQGSQQSRGLSGIDQKEFERVKRELAQKDKRYQEQSELLQRKLGSMKESFEKSERERISAIREREKLKAELEQARIRIASAQIPEVSVASSVQDETIMVVKGGSAAKPAAASGAKVIPIRDPKGGALESSSAAQAQAPVSGTSPRTQTQAGVNPQQSPEAPKKSGGFGSKLLKSLNPFSGDSKEKDKPSVATPPLNAAAVEKNNAESPVASAPESVTKAPAVEGIDPRVLAQKEKVHERQVEELHRKIRKLEEDNAKLREKTVRIDSQVLDQNTKTLKARNEASRDVQDTTQADVSDPVAVEAKKEIEARKKRIEEEDQKALSAAAASEPAPAKPVAKEIADPEARTQSIKAAKTLEDLKSAVEKTDSPTMKKVLAEIQQSVEPGKSKQWTESLMAEIVSEKARIMDLQRTLNMEFKAAEQSYRNRENLLQTEVQKRDDTLRQKEALLNRKNEQLAQLNLQLDQLKQGSLAVEEAQLKHKLAAAQKMAEMKDFENKSLIEKTRDLENKLMIANAKARNTNEAQWKQKIQALEFKLEEAKKQATRNQDISSQTKDKASDRELLDLKKKYELAERQQQEMRKMLERTAANLKEKTDGERRFQLEAQKLQEENKKLKALMSRAGSGGSNAA